MLGRKLGSKNRRRPILTEQGEWRRDAREDLQERQRLAALTGEKVESYRGNFTRGEHRRGNRSGSRPAYPGIDPALISKHLIKLNPRHKALAKALGAGKVLRGLREALDLAARALPLWAQDLEQVDERLLLCFAKRDFKRMTSEMQAAVHKALLETWYEPSLTVEQMEAREDAKDEAAAAIRVEMLEIKRQAELQGWVRPKAMRPAGDVIDEIKGG